MLSVDMFDIFVTEYHEAFDMFDIFVTFYCEDFDMFDIFVTEYREAFDMFDMDHDNRISTAELRKMMEQLGQKPTEQEIKSIMKSADVDSK